MALLDQRDSFGKLEPSLTERALRTVSHLVADTGQEAIAAPLRVWLEKQIVAEPENDRWKWHLVRLFIASDQPEQLEKQLRAWIRPDRVDQNWRTLLAYLMAEQNRLPEAIAEAEALRRSSAGISGDALLVLADWYLVIGDLKSYQQALVDALESSPSYVLNRLLGDDGGFTGDAATPAVLAALTRKSVTNDEALGWMIGLYEQTKDPRLLAGLPEAVRGHTPNEIYDFMMNDVAALTSLIYDEASTDAVIEALQVARTAAGDNQTDLRSLDLLELAVARRAAELADQPDPWIGRARAALQRACTKDWEERERELMAQFLFSLGKIDAEALATEQRKQLHALYKEAEPDTTASLRTGLVFAQTLGEYSMYQAEADLLEPHVTAEAPQDGELLRITAAFQMVEALEVLGQFARAEKVIDREAIRGHSYDWQVRRHENWLGALEEGATVSAGSGRELYAALRDALQDETFKLPFDGREDLADLLFEAFIVAKEKKFKTVKSDVVNFLDEMFSGAKPHNSELYAETIVDLSEGLPELIGDRATLTFLLDRADDEPAWMRLSGEGIWELTGDEMSELRKGLFFGGEATERMLALASRDIAKTIAQGEVPDAEAFDHESDFFWKSKRAHFADIAEKVARQHLDNPEVVEAAGDFLFEYLGLDKRGLALALDAIEAGTFDDDYDTEIELEFAEELVEFGEASAAIALTENYLEKHTDSNRALLMLMEAKFAAGERDELPDLLARANATLGEKPGAWEHSKIARTCLKCELYADALKGFEAALAQRHEEHGEVLLDNQKAAADYTGLAKAHAALGNTRAAVEAISGAIVSGSHQQRLRHGYIDTLTKILADAPDLENFAAEFDQAAARSTTENPILRKAIASALMSRDKFEPAIHHLRSAIEYQPNNPTLRTELIAALDRSEHPELAAIAQLELASLDRKHPHGYRDLAKRYVLLGNPNKAERARDSIVEVNPSEAKNHRLLAEVRQEQDRWDAAIAHWQKATELHTTDPVSLLGLTRANLHERHWDAAEQSLERLKTTKWPERFQPEVDKAVKEFQVTLSNKSGTSDQSEE